MAEREETAAVDLDDNLEFIDSHDSDPAPDEQEVRKISGIPETQLRRLKRLARQSQLSYKQATLFRSEVELDLLRKDEDRLGIERLFVVYAEKGSAHWLNPVPHIRQLDEILRKYAGRGSLRRDTLAPLLELLVEIAQQDINPTAFLRYVMLPRLLPDGDWRKWIERHLSPLRRIAEILVAMRGDPPFDKEILGSESTRLSRDIVLVKYAGKPLARYSPNDLTDERLVREYREAWKNLSLDNAFTILFMKTNVLHFMYSMSGRISFQQLIGIMERMPEIERGFRENYPADLYNIDVAKIDLNLYDYDINKSIEARRREGFSKNDFVLELQAYMRVIKTLLGTTAGIYLCGYFARRMRADKSHELAELLSRLIETVRDSGGRYAYTWHTSRMLKRPAPERGAYIDLIEEHGGYDPEYPRAAHIFRNPLEEYFAPVPNFIPVAALELGLSEEDLARAGDGQSGSASAHRWYNPGLILRAYRLKYPESDGIIEKFQEDITTGRDRGWDHEHLRKLDGLGRALHVPLLKSVIQGLRAPAVADSFETLANRYESLELERSLEVSHEFTMARTDRQGPDVHRFRQQEVRRQLDLGVFREVWTCLEETPPESINNLARHVNAQVLSLREPEERVGGQLISLEQQLQEEGNEENRKMRKKTERLQKSLAAIRQQRAGLQAVLNTLEEIHEDLRFPLLLHVAASQAKAGSAFSREMLAWIINRYSGDEAVSGRIAYLQADIPIELLTLEQAGHIVNTLETLRLRVMHDVEATFEKHRDSMEEFNSVVEPFILTRVKTADAASADAAFAKLCSLGKMNALQARWRELLQKTEDAQEGEPWLLFTSKTPVDAYYGHMGGICLSQYPDMIRNQDFAILRLSSPRYRQIQGMAALFRSHRGLPSCPGTPASFWHAFAINPLPSLLNRQTQRQQLMLYLHYRLILEQLSLQSGLPVVLSGIGTWGIVSNSTAFAAIVTGFERRVGSVEVFDARGLSLYYSEEQYARALLMIHPGRQETVLAQKILDRFGD
jgi:hypothetical protein